MSRQSGNRAAVQMPLAATSRGVINDNITAAIEYHSVFILI